MENKKGAVKIEKDLDTEQSAEHSRAREIREETAKESKEENEKSTEKSVVYVAELDADVDDVIAAEYLNNRGVLRCVVLDPLPKTQIGKDRQKALEKLGIDIETKLPNNCKYVFCGGALTSIAQYIKTRHIDCLVMNGGFVGSNIVNSKDELEKFKGKETVRTFNFNCDIEATDRVLKSSSRQIGKIVLVGKNVCHSELNTESGFWKADEYKKLFKKYNVKPGKKQHDMLACHEGLAMLGIEGVTVPWCTFLEVYPYNEGLKGNMTKWGSKLGNSGYRKVVAAVSIVNK